MDKVKGLIVIVVAVLSVVVTIIVANLLLDTTGIVNQGNYRISEVVVKSSANVREIQDDEKEIRKLSDFEMDIIQTNDISILVEANVEPEKIELQNLEITQPTLCDRMTISQNGESKYLVTPELKDLDISIEQENEKYIINLLIDNETTCKGVSVDEAVEEIQFDAKIFDVLKVNREDLKFSVSFDLYITDKHGETSKTHIDLQMPTDETFSNGMSILKQDISKFIFTIDKNNKI